MFILKILILLVFCIISYFYIYIPYKYPLPISNHSDGKIFFNINHELEPQKDIRKVFRWLFNMKKTRSQWPSNIAVEKYDIPPSIVDGKDLRVSFVGHASFLIQTNGLNIITDPIYSDRASMFQWIGPKRVTEPGIMFDNLPKIDIVLVSHNHYDHLDKTTLYKLWENHDPLFITPLRNNDLIKSYVPSARIVSLDWFEDTKIGNGVDIILEPAHHWSSRWVLDRNRMLWGTFVINTKEGAIIFIGDTGYDNKIYKNIGEKYENIILSIIPIGAYEPRYIMQNSHVNPYESILIHQDLRSKKSLASHYITFQLTDESYDKPLIDLEEAKTNYGTPKNDFMGLKVGQFIEITK